MKKTLFLIFLTLFLTFFLSFSLVGAETYSDTIYGKLISGNRVNYQNITYYGGGGNFSFENFTASFILNSTLLNTTYNIGVLFNYTASMIANLSINQLGLTANGNFYHENFTEAFKVNSSIINSTYNIGVLFNVTASQIANLSISQSISGGNFYHENFTDSFKTNASIINTTENIGQLYNSTSYLFLNLINTTENIGNLYNYTASMIANISISQSISGGNFYHENFSIAFKTNSSIINNTKNLQENLNSSGVVYRDSNATLISCSNITGVVSDLCSIQTGNVSGGGGNFYMENFSTSFKTNVSIINTTENIGQLYNSTASIISNISAQQYIDMINNTRTIGQHYNETASMIANISISQAGLSNYWSTNGTSVYNDTAKAFGLGDPTPTNMLDIVGSLAVRSAVHDGYEAPENGIYSQGSINIGGVGGLGELDIYESTATDEATIRLSNADTGSGSTDGYRMSMYTNTFFFQWLYENLPMVFATNNLARLTIGANGLINVSGDLFVVDEANASMFNGAWNGSSLYAPNTTYAIGQLFNATASQIANLSISQSISGGNFYHENFTDSFKTNASIINTTENIGQLYNSTASIISNISAQQYIDMINNTRTIGQHYNETASMIANISISQSISGGNFYHENFSIAFKTNSSIINNTKNLQENLNSSGVVYRDSNATLISCSNITGASSDLCSIITGNSTGGGGNFYMENFTDSFKTNASIINTTENIGQLYNSTSYLFLNLINNTKNIQELLNSTGIYSTYNESYHSFNTTYNIGVLFNATASQIANLSISQSISGGNFYHENFTDSFKTNASIINTTENIGQLYNSTSLLFLALINKTNVIEQLYNVTSSIISNVSSQQYVDMINNTNTIQLHINDTQIQFLGINITTNNLTLSEGLNINQSKVITFGGMQLYSNGSCGIMKGGTSTFELC